MINPASLSNLTDTEIVKALDERRNKSPIIDELCKRLENLTETIEKVENLDENVECPVCLAKLSIINNEKENKFVLEIK